MDGENTLYYGDNLEVIRLYIKDESIDLIYLDPPFKSARNYNILFEERNGSRSTAQLKAFEDSWYWDKSAAESYQETVEKGGRVSQALQSFHKILGLNDMLAYLSMMAPRLLELRRVLKQTGSIYLHCDNTASHYLKLLMDAVFGPVNFRNEIIWRRTANNQATKRFGPIHQSILFYSRSDKLKLNPIFNPYTVQYVDEYFNKKDDRGRYQSVALTGPGITKSGQSGKPWRGYNPTDSGRHWAIPSYLLEKYRVLTGVNLNIFPLMEKLNKLDEIGLIEWGNAPGKVPRYKQYLEDMPGSLIQDLWAYQPGTTGCVYSDPEAGIDEDVRWLMAKDSEKLGYPTQKPVGLLKRIIKASSDPDDVVLDPFCGCGTTIYAAEEIGRKWIGIDITFAAITLVKNRLRDLYGDGLKYKIVGEPVTLSEAKELAEQNRSQFEWWALGLVGARPVEQERKRGADRGIDGRLYFHDEAAVGKTKQIVFSVKSGKVSVKDIRDLRGVTEREKAEIGALITLQKPTQPMRTEIAGAGFYTSPWGKHPRMQIITIEELLEGRRIDYPAQTNVTFKKARRNAKENNNTKELL